MKTKCRWRVLDEVVEPGIYLMMHERDLPLNSLLVCIEEDEELGLVRPGQHPSRVHCEGGKAFRYFGPIPFPEPSTGFDANGSPAP